MQRTSRTSATNRLAVAALALSALAGCDRGVSVSGNLPRNLPSSTVVRLGDSGDSITLVSTSGGWTHEGQAIASGDTVTAENGATYRLTRSGSTWTATFVVVPTELHLGALGGTVQLTVREGGSWTVMGQVRESGDSISPGDSVTSTVNGFSYRLTLVDGSWQASPQPLSIPVTLQGGPGGSVTVTQVEDGTYFYEGEPVDIGQSFTVDERRYVLSRSSGGDLVAIAGSIIGPTPTPGDPSASDSMALGSYVGPFDGARPGVQLTEAGSSSTREGSMLTVNGLDYPVSSLFASGSHRRAATFVDQARVMIAEELNLITRLVALGPDVLTPAVLEGQVRALWSDVADHLDSVFPGEGLALLGDLPERRGEIDYDDTVGTLQGLLDALSTRLAFTDALVDGVFQRSGLDPADSSARYRATESDARLEFGWTETTRYGAYSKRERSSVAGNPSFARGDEGIGAFAYSPLEPTNTSSLPLSGSASYSGETVAASRESDQATYRGEFEMQASFASRQVAAVVLDLVDANGNAWRHAARDVSSIQLPNARLHASNGRYEAPASGTARVAFSAFGGGMTPSTLDSEFEGRFVGTGAEAGHSTIGTWSLEVGGVTVLAGGFGAEIDGTLPGGPSGGIPPSPDVNPLEVPETWMGSTRPDSSGRISIAATDSGGNRIRVPVERLAAEGQLRIEGARLFDLAIAELDPVIMLLDLYSRVFVDDTATNREIRDGVWASANDDLQEHVFGAATEDARLLGASYPAGSTIAARDEAALERIEGARAALASLPAFLEAVDEGGVFERALSRSLLNAGGYDLRAIYSAVESEVGVAFGSTNFGRFGVWAKTARDFALGDSELVSGAAGSGVFAYSPLDQTGYPRGSTIFPRGFTSTFSGRTFAVDTSEDEIVVYDGDLSVSVNWTDSASGPVGSHVTTTVAGLVRSDNGAPAEDLGREIRNLVFTGARVDRGANGLISFDGASAVRVTYRDPSRTDRTSRAGVAAEGKFVGIDLSGPDGVIGTWSWRSFDGAFSADLLP